MTRMFFIVACMVVGVTVGAGRTTRANDYGHDFSYTSPQGWTYRQNWNLNDQGYSNGFSMNTPSWSYGTQQSSNYRSNSQTYGQFYRNGRTQHGQGYRIGPGQYRSWQRHSR